MTPQPGNMPQSQSHSHTFLYLLLGLLLMTVIVLLAIIGNMYYKNKTAISQVTQNPTPPPVQTMEKANPTPSPTLSISPITSKHDLDNQLKTLDNTDMTSITTNLNQNSADSSQFAQ